MKRTFLTFIIFLVVFACENSEKSVKDKNETSLNKNVNQSPCELLTEKEIKEILSIPADAETSMKEKNTNFPSCFYKWESITWPYTLVNDRVSQRPAEMSIVWVTGANKKKYDVSTSYYKDGVEVKGVGEMATWGERKSQLTFLYKGNLIHVNAKTSADVASNKANAIELAKLIVKKL